MDQKKEKSKNLTEMIRDSFQSNQNYMDKKFGEMYGYMDGKFAQVDKKFEQVTEKINNISLNIVDIVRLDDFEKLKDRVEVVEESLNLPNE
jgi:tetrahydromethanopterin S-methyltransferase subunit G